MIIKMEEKLKIIDKICERHPAYGLKKGWSEYVGGMADTGRWFTRKMLDVSIEELQSFLDWIISEENKPKQVLTEEERADCEITHSLGNGIWINEYERKILEKFRREVDQKLYYD